MKLLFLTLLLISTLNNCTTTKPPVRLGIDVLSSNNFEQLRGKRIGLITNQTGVNSNLTSTIDILSSNRAKYYGVSLVALFAPEHGVRGDIEAGLRVKNNIDAKSGVVIHSLYGNGHKPTSEMLKDIDALVFDIQDIGSRSYTFISTLGLTMEAAANNNKEFIVLDRPNPLGGLKVEGGSVATEYNSFVSKYPIPYIHGLTIGELAMLYNGEGFLSDSVQCNLSVVSMGGWRRDMLWDDTGLAWVPTSPHIPQHQTTMHYPVTGVIGELQTMNIGVGYTIPFEVFATEWISDAEALADKLNMMSIDGVMFRPIYLRPFYGGSRNKSLKGIQVHITDFDKAPLTMIMFYVVDAINQLHPNQTIFSGAKKSRLSMFDKVMGNSSYREMFVESGYNSTLMRKYWDAERGWFSDTRERYLLYR